MKTTSLVLLCLGLIASLGAAETAPPPAATTAQIELAGKVIKATQFDRIFDQMGVQMQQMAAQSMNLSNPNLTPAQKESATKLMGEVMKLSMDAAKSMLSKIDVIYAEVYSEAELKAMLAFFESSEGKSMLQKQPQIMQRMMPLIQDMQKDLVPKIQKITEKAKADADAAAPATAPALPAPQK